MFVKKITSSVQSHNNKKTLEKIALTFYTRNKSNSKATRSPQNKASVVVGVVDLENRRFVAVEILRCGTAVMRFVHCSPRASQEYASATNSAALPSAEQARQRS